MNDNPFELLGLPESFRIDTAVLAAAWHELQAHHHPDRHVGGTDAERRRAAELSTSINEAYETLKDDYRRACWLLERRGIPVGDGERTVHDPAILMEQMELRERLADAESGGDAEGADRILREANALRREVVEAVAASFDRDDLPAVAPLAVRLRFFDKLVEEAKRLAERLEDG